MQQFIFCFLLFEKIIRGVARGDVRDVTSSKFLDKLAFSSNSTVNAILIDQELFANNNGRRTFGFSDVTILFKRYCV